MSLGFVRVGNPGNAADPSAGSGADASMNNVYGSVAYEYQIGTHEVTIGQYAAFLNAVAKADPYQLYNPAMATDGRTAGITRSGTSGTYSYAVTGPVGDTSRGSQSAANRPITYVSWFDAARFANWLHNGQPTGPQGAGTTESGAYALNGVVDGAASARTGAASFFVPTENEWYKAAYHDPIKSGYWDYATRSNGLSDNAPLTFATAPTLYPRANVWWAATGHATTGAAAHSATQNVLTDVGSYGLYPSAYGTYDQTGNVYEWTDLAAGGLSDGRAIRGGSWAGAVFDRPTIDASDRSFSATGAETSYIGFRLAAAIPPVIAATSPAGVAAAAKAWSSDRIDLTFSLPVSKASAQDAAAYVLQKVVAGPLGGQEFVAQPVVPTIVTETPAGVTTVRLTATGGPLQSGTYRLTVTGGGATIRTPAGVAIDGDGDGFAGGGWSRLFTVDAAAGVDVTPPAVTVVVRTTDDTRPELSGTVDDPAATVAVAFGGRTFMAVNSGSGTWSLPATAVADPFLPGVYDVVATARDAFGNSSTDATTGELTIREPEGDARESAFAVVLGGNAFERRAMIGDGSAGAADVDYYKVRLLANTLVSAEVFAGRVAPASRFNAVLQLFDANGTRLALDDNSAGSGDPRISGFVIATTGDYFFAVSDDGDKTAGGSHFADTGNYRLVVTVTPDTTPPAAGFTPIVSPTPLAIDSAVITFTENVSGVDAADFTLTRNGSPVSLAGASVTGAGRWYTLAGMASATGPVGDYVLTLRASGTGVVDESGNALSVAAAVGWTVSQVASAPRDVRTYVTGTSAYVSWLAPSSPGGGPTSGYTLQYRRVGDSAWTSRTVSAATGARIDGLVANAIYQVRVAAVNTFGTGAFTDRNVVVTGWSEVGLPGNAADGRTGRGAVGYRYSIGTYEVTIGQYVAFLNAVAATDTLGLFNPSLETDLNVAGIRRSGQSGSFSYEAVANGGDSSSRPVTYVSWDDAYRFVNWLHNGQPAAAAGAADTTDGGAYARSGSSWTLQAGARYRLPTIDEWYKAAYHSPDAASGYYSYATRSDTKPDNVIEAAANRANYKLRYSSSVFGSIRWYTKYTTTQADYSATANYLTSVGAFTGSPGPFGTFDQEGGVSELLDDLRVTGSNWSTDALGYSSGAGAFDSNFTGFRLVAPAASVPTAPSGVTAEPGVRSVTLAWNAPPATHGSLVYDYVVEYRNATQSPAQWTTVSRGPSVSPTAVIDGLVERQSYAFRVRAVSLAGESPVSAETAAVVVRSPAAPTAVALSATAVPENSPAASVIGTLTTSDPTDSTGFTYGFVSGTGDADNGSFTISGDRLLVKAPLDYESRASYSIRVRTTDPGGDFIESSFTIRVTDVNEAPGIRLSDVVTSLRATSSSALTKVATITVLDDALGTNAIALAGPDAGSFQVSGGALYLKAGERLSASLRPTLSVTVNVADATLPDAGPASASLTFTVAGNGRPTLAPAVPVAVRVPPSNAATVPASGSTIGSVLVSALVAAEAAPGNFSDPDGDPPGLAIIGAKLAGGRLWFSTDDGGRWTEVGAVSETSATLLHADTRTRLFFAPAQGFLGTLADVLTIRAWDRAGDYANGATGVNTLSMRLDLFDRRVGRLDHGSSRRLVRSTDGRFVFVAAYDAGLKIVDLANPAAPLAAGSYDTSGSAWDVALSADGRYAFVADNTAGVQVIDVTDRANPVRVGGYDTSGYAIGVTLSADGRYAYVADDSAGLQVIDVTDRANPVRVGGYDTSGAAAGVTLSADGRYAYVADYDAGLQIVNVSVPANPVFVAGFDTRGYAWEVGLSGDGRHAFVADDFGDLSVIDVSNPAKPVGVGTLALNGSARGLAMSADRRYAFVSDGSAQGVQVIDLIAPSSPQRVDSLFASAFTQNVILSADERYAIVTTSGGLVVIDRSLPASPAPLGTFDTAGRAGGVSLSPDGRYAFVADASTGLQVIDVGAPASPARVGGYDTAGSGQGVVLSPDGRYAFVADGTAGVAVIDAQNRAAPVLAKTLQRANYSVQTGTTGYWNGWTWVSVPVYRDFYGSTTDIALTADGRYAYFADTDGGVEVWDVSIPSSPLYKSEIWPSGTTRSQSWNQDEISAVALSPDARYAYAGSADGTLFVLNAQWNALAKVGQGSNGYGYYISDIAVSADGRYVYVCTSNYYSFGTISIWNVTNPASPTIVGSADVGGPGAAAVRLSADGRFAYVAAGSAGLVVFDVSVPTAPTAVSRYYDGASIGGAAFSADGRFAFLGAEAAGLRTTDMWSALSPFSLQSVGATARVVANAAPSALALAPAAVSENSAAGTVVGTFTTTDADVGETFAYTLVAGVGDGGNAAFTIAGNTLVTNESFDRETRASYAVRVRATDSGGLWVENTFTVMVTDVNEAPRGVSLVNAVATLPENTATTTRVKVADILVADDALGSNVFTLGGPDAATFEVGGAALYLKAGTSLDYEAQAAYAITLTVADATVAGGAPASVAYALAIADVNEAPVAVVLDNAITRLPENTSTSTRIKLADIVVLDDALGTNVLGLAGADTVAFEIDGRSLYLRAGTRLSYAVQPSLAVSVVASDATATGPGPVLVSFTLNLERTVFPSMSVQGTPTALTATLGAPSPATTVAVTGANLTSAIIATAPVGFEVASDGSTFGPTATFTPVGGAVAGTLFVRLAASTPVGTHAGSVSLSSTGTAGASVAVPASTVTDTLVFDVASGQSVTYSTPRSGALKLVKRGPGTLVLDAASAHSGQTTVEAGTLVIATADALAASVVRVQSGATLKVNAGVTMRAPSLTVAGGTLDGTGATILVNAASGIGTFAITSGAVTGSPRLTVSGNGVVILPTDRRQTVALTALTVDQATGGRLDLGKGRIDVAVGGTTEADLRADVIAGRNAGAFNGTSGIMTTGGTAGLATQPVVGYRILSTGAAIVAWAVSGDANLDGQVNITDINLVNNGRKFGQGPSTGATWSQGDYNYSGGVTITDMNLVNNAQLFSKGSFLPVAPANAQMAAGSDAATIPQEVWIAYAIDAESRKTTKR